MDEEVYKIIPEDELYARTGIQKAMYNTIYQLMALKTQNPEYLEKADAMLMIPDFFHYKLSGKKVQEYTEATTSQLVNPETKDWDYELIEKLDGMLTRVAFIEERSPQIVKEYREKLEAKVQELLGDVKVDESRLLTEVTIFADKSCVDEEIVRLKSHIATTKATLISGGDIGRKLDFIAQEMNREANTTLSKSNDLEISNCAIELKTEIEKVREQIQNIE